MAPEALGLYEALRSAVLAGQPRPEGYAALRFHGMVHGLATLLRAPTEPATVEAPWPASQHAPRDPQFVRLLANIVLRAHAEMTHVY